MFLIKILKSLHKIKFYDCFFFLKNRNTTLKQLENGENRKF